MRQAPYISQSNDKDDPGDAYKLAELLCWKPWLLHPIQYRREQTQADLSWIRAPAAFAESRKQLINTVRAFSKPGAQSLVHPPEAQNLVLRYLRRATRPLTGPDGHRASEAQGHWGDAAVRSQPSKGPPPTGSK